MIVEIRPARLSDAQAVASLATQLGYPTSREQARQRLEALAPLDDHAVFLAVNGQREIAGMLHVYLSLDPVAEPRAEIGSLIVDSSQRSQGIGQALTGAAEAWARAHNLPGIGVHCNVLRERAHIFYERLGFKRLKTQYEFRKGLDVGHI